MNFAQSAQNKKILILAIMSILVSAVFSILSAPFLKTFAATTRPIIFWSVGSLFVSALILMSQHNSQMFQIAIYTGAVWMTLGTYNEFEKRGINWRYSGLLSLVSGYLFAIAGYFIFLKPEQRKNLLNEIISPILQALQKAFPNSEFEIGSIINLTSGLFVASLMAALAFGFLMEQQIAQLFQIKKLKVASALKWLQFKLPDVFVWMTLISMFFVLENFGIQQLKLISLNILIVAAVALFFQGLVVIEFTLRVYRVGAFARAIAYLLIFIQLSPFVAFLGLADYWVDFRMFMRRRLQNKSDTN